jgi:hypothetical protein
MLPHHLGDPPLQLLALLAAQLPQPLLLDVQSHLLLLLVLDLEDVLLVVLAAGSAGEGPGLGRRGLPLEDLGQDDQIFGFSFGVVDRINDALRVHTIINISKSNCPNKTLLLPPLFYFYCIILLR